MERDLEINVYVLSLILYKLSARRIRALIV